MKVSEYIAAFSAYYVDDAELAVVPILVDELNNLIVVRRATTDQGVYAAFREIEHKYKLICDCLKLDRASFRDALFEIDDEIRQVVHFCTGGSR